jgi:hypothetical protein
MRRALVSAAVVLAVVTVLPAVVWVGVEYRRASLAAAHAGAKRRARRLVTLSEEWSPTGLVWSPTALQRDTARVLRMRETPNRKAGA